MVPLHKACGAVHLVEDCLAEDAGCSTCLRDNFVYYRRSGVRLKEGGGWGGGLVFHTPLLSRAVRFFSRTRCLASKL